MCVVLGGRTGGGFLSPQSHLAKCFAGGEQEGGLALHLLIPVPINHFPAIPVSIFQLPPLPPCVPHPPTHMHEILELGAD